MPRMGAQQLLHIPAAVAEVVLAEGIGNEHMLGPEGISILGNALLIGREAVGQVADIGRLGEKSDALIALLLQKKPYLTPALVKMRLHDTAVSIRLPKEQQGWGMLDVKALLDS